MESIKEITGKFIKGMKNGWKRLSEEDIIDSQEVDLSADVQARLSELEKSADPTYKPTRKTSISNESRNYKNESNIDKTRTDKESQNYNNEKNIRRTIIINNQNINHDEQDRNP